MNKKMKASFFKVFFMRSIIIVVGFLFMNLMTILFYQKNILMFIIDTMYMHMDLFDKLPSDHTIIIPILQRNLMIFMLLFVIKIASKLVANFYFLGFESIDLKECARNLMTSKKGMNGLKEKSLTSGAIILYVIWIAIKMLGAALVSFLYIILQFAFTMITGAISGGFISIIAIIVFLGTIVIILSVAGWFIAFMALVLFPFITYFIVDIASSKFVYKFYGYTIISTTSKLTGSKSKKRLARMFFSISDIILGVLCCLISSNFVIGSFPDLYAKYEHLDSINTPLGYVVFGIAILLYIITSFVSIFWKNHVLITNNIIQPDEELRKKLTSNMEKKETKKILKQQKNESKANTMQVEAVNDIQNED